MQRRLIATDGLTQNVFEQGSGPLVLLCHGFPELAWSWRAQIPALAAAGYRVVAPDMRGYGATDKPAAVEAYSLPCLVGDLVDLVRALGETTATVVGHDWGAQVAWTAAQLRPDVFTAVAGLSVPFRPRVPGKPPAAYWRAMTKRLGLGDFYMVRFQDPGAEAEFDADVATAVRRLYRSYDGATPDDQRSSGFVPEGMSFLQSTPSDGIDPPWLTEQILAPYVAAFTAGGFGPPLNWYRNLDRNYELLAFAQGLGISVPALFLTGARDPVRGYGRNAEDEMPQWIPDLRDRIVVPGAGHWIQQERPDVVNAALIGFLNAVY
jgi:pimeloyl-ACP methyl ester carboxylesterase